jgi:hypothetical protein
MQKLPATAKGLTFSDTIHKKSARNLNLYNFCHSPKKLAAVSPYSFNTFNQRYLHWRQINPMIRSILRSCHQYLYPCRKKICPVLTSKRVEPGFIPQITRSARISSTSSRAVCTTTRWYRCPLVWERHLLLLSSCTIFSAGTHKEKSSLWPLPR